MVRARGARRRARVAADARRCRRYWSCHGAIRTRLPAAEAALGLAARRCRLRRRRAWRCARCPHLRHAVGPATTLRTRVPSEASRSVARSTMSRSDCAGAARRSARRFTQRASVCARSLASEEACDLARAENKPDLWASRSLELPKSIANSAISPRPSHLYEEADASHSARECARDGDSAGQPGEPLTCADSWIAHAAALRESMGLRSGDEQQGSRRMPARCRGGARGRVGQSRNRGALPWRDADPDA